MEPLVMKLNLTSSTTRKVFYMRLYTVYFRCTFGLLPVPGKVMKKLYKPNIEFHPDELYLETVPLDTFVKGYFTIQTTNLGFKVLN